MGDQEIARAYGSDLNKDELKWARKQWNNAVNDAYKSGNALNNIKLTQDTPMLDNLDNRISEIRNSTQKDVDAYTEKLWGDLGYTKQENGTYKKINAGQTTSINDTPAQETLVNPQTPATPVKSKIDWNKQATDAGFRDINEVKAYQQAYNQRPGVTQLTVDGLVWKNTNNALKEYTLNDFRRDNMGPTQSNIQKTITGFDGNPINFNNNLNSNQSSDLNNPQQQNIIYNDPFFKTLGRGLTKFSGDGKSYFKKNGKIYVDTGSYLDGKYKEVFDYDKHIFDNWELTSELKSKLENVKNWTYNIHGHSFVRDYTDKDTGITYSYDPRSRNWTRKLGNYKETFTLKKQGGCLIPKNKNGATLVKRITKKNNNIIEQYSLGGWLRGLFKRNPKVSENTNTTSSTTSVQATMDNVAASNNNIPSKQTIMSNLYGDDWESKTNYNGTSLSDLYDQGNNSQQFLNSYNQKRDIDLTLSGHNNDTARSIYDGGNYKKYQNEYNNAMVNQYQQEYTNNFYNSLSDEEKSKYDDFYMNTYLPQKKKNTTPNFSQTTEVTAQSPVQAPVTNSDPQYYQQGNQNGLMQTMIQVGSKYLTN